MDSDMEDVLTRRTLQPHLQLLKVLSKRLFYLRRSTMAISHVQVV
jgi:hypothetical protein